MSKKSSKGKASDPVAPSLGISAWLSSAAPVALGRAVGVTPVAREVVHDDDSDNSSDDSNDDDDNEDERLLELRRLNDLEEGGEDGYGNDWIAGYADEGEEDDDSEDEEGEDGDDSEGDSEEQDSEPTPPPPPPPPPSRSKKVKVEAPPPPSAPLKVSAVAVVAAQNKGLVAGAAVPVTSIPAADVAALARVAGKVSKEKTAAAAAASASTTSLEVNAAALLPGPARAKASSVPVVNAPSTSDTATTAARAPKRPMPKAFVPVDIRSTVFLGNLPLDSTDAALRTALTPFGKIATIHREVNNSGAPSGFGYAEFTSASAAAAAAGATTNAPKLGAREIKVLVYTPALNYRKPDGSRNKEKKKRTRGDGQQEEDDKTSHAPGERKAGKKPRPARA